MTLSGSSFPAKDLIVVRDLAEQVMEFARDEEMVCRRKRWRDVNERRRPDRAPVWCRPAGAWSEILPEKELRCVDELCRNVEYSLRQHLYKKWVGDDHILEPWWGLGVTWRCESEHTWGLPVRRSLGSTKEGGFSYDHPVKNWDDYDRITVPHFTLDQGDSERRASRMVDLLGEVMPVRLLGSPALGPHLSVYLEQLRGMVPMMEDMMLRPECVHRAMARIAEGVLAAQRAAEEAKVLTPNHHEPMFCSDPVNGGIQAPLGLHQRWVSSNSQEFDQVSPAMQEEFLLSYQNVLFQQYGAVQYGCCENLTRKIETVLGIPHLRIFVVSFWTDLEKVLEASRGRHTIMWRQSAAQVTLPKDLSEHKEHLDKGLAQLQGIPHQIVLRELQTLRGRPNRLRDWARLAIRLEEQIA